MSITRTSPRRRTAVLGMAGVAATALLVAGCGSSSSYGGGSTKTTTTQAGAAPARVDSAVIRPLGSVLTGPNGHTLYYLTTETSSSIQCTSGCTSIWPPLVIAGGSSPTRAPGVTGTLSTAMRPDGTTQVTVNGHPAYYYSGDAAAGHANGQGINGTWFVLKSGSAVGGGSSTPQTNSGSGGSANGY